VPGTKTTSNSNELEGVIQVYRRGVTTKKISALTISIFYANAFFKKLEGCMNHAFTIKESVVRLPGITPNLTERLNRLPVNLEALLDDPEAKVDFDENNLLLTIESSRLSLEDIFFPLEKSVRSLNLSFSKTFQSAFN
jgi:hypothetical protein